MMQTKHFSDYCLAHISYEFYVLTPGNFISFLIDLGIFLSKNLRKNNNKKTKTKNEKIEDKKESANDFRHTYNDFVC